MEYSLSHYLNSSTANNFSVLRLAAAAAVLFGHSFAFARNGSEYHEPINSLLPFTYSGDIGIDVFFLISGIFVTQSLFIERNFLSFTIKRCGRIFPGLIVCLCVTVALVVIVASGSGLLLFANPPTYEYILNNATLNLQLTIPGVFEDRKYATVNGSLWSLPLEVKMYACVFFFGIFSVIWKRGELFIVAVGLTLAIVIAPPAFEGFFGPLAGHVTVAIIFYLAGVALFALRDSVKVGAPQIVSTLIAYFALKGPLSPIIGNVLIAEVAIWLGCSELLNRIRMPKSDYSYGLYIYGFPVQQSIVSLWPSLTPYWFFAVTSISVLPFAIASWHFVEFPAQVASRSISRAILREGSFGAIVTAIRTGAVRLVVPAAFAFVAVVGLIVTSARLDSMPASPLGAEIVLLGPAGVTHGQPFNLQPNGLSAIWLKLNHQAKSDFAVVLNGRRLITTVVGMNMSAYVPPELYARAGSSPLWIESRRAARKFQSKPVAFVVK